MVERKEFLDFLIKELKRLRKEKIIKLILSKKYQIVDEILLFGENEVFVVYTKEPTFRKIRMKEIPEEYKLIFVIYLLGAGTDESLILKEREELIKWLENSKSHRRLCKKIARKLKKHFLFEFDRKVEELMKEEESM